MTKENSDVQKKIKGLEHSQGIKTDPPNSSHLKATDDNNAAKLKAKTHEIDAAYGQSCI